MIPWFENIHCRDNLRERLEEGSEEKHLIGPLEASHVERSILRKIERSNVKGVYVIDDTIEDIDTKGTESHWPWEYPKFSWDEKVLTQSEGVKRFHDLMWNMHKVYKTKATKNFIKKRIGFTYRSEFERRIYELPEELQAKIFSKVWNRGRIGIGKWVKGTTSHRGYHYPQEGLLYNLYFERVMIKLYNGLERLENSERGLINLNE
jgi:hypothetical protein